MKIEICIVIVLINAVISGNNNYSLYSDTSTDKKYYSYNTSSIRNCPHDEHLCIKKCCKNGHILYYEENNSDEYLCKENKYNESVNFSVPVYDGQIYIFNITDYVIEKIKCDKANIRSFNKTENIYLQRDGKLYYPSRDENYTKKMYCVDEADELTIYMCPKQKNEEIETLIHFLAKIIPTPFLIFTGVVYALLPERNLHNTALMFHVLSLAGGNMLLAHSQYVLIEDDTLCFLSAYFAIFFMVGAFFWMNVICIDIWLVFSFRMTYAQKKNKKSLMLAASIYAWGIPALNDLIIFIVSIYGDKESKYYPGIGDEACFLAGIWPNVIYYFGSILVLIVFNLILFLMTAINIRKAKKEAKLIQSSESKIHSNKDDDKIRLYWKLLFVMGLDPGANTHVIQLIGWSFGKKFSHKTVVYIWYLKDFSHAAYGIIVFIFFVCEKRIWISLTKRFPSLKNIIELKILKFPKISESGSNNTLNSDNTCTSEISTRSTDNVEAAVS